MPPGREASPGPSIPLYAEHTQAYYVLCTQYMP